MSRDAATLVSGGKDGEVLVWDAAQQPERRSAWTLGGRYRGWAFSPDGRVIHAVERATNAPNAPVLALEFPCGSTDSRPVALSAAAGSNSGLTTVDLAAPGALSVTTTAGPGITAYTDSFGFTSAAAPHVAGAAALRWAAKPDATLEQVTAALLGSADHPAGLRGKLTFTPNTAWQPTNHMVRILGTAFDLSGRSLDGNYDLTSQGSPADDFVWTVRPPLANGDLAGAQPIAGESGQVKASNRSASLEVDEPFFWSNGAATVWYQRQPPRSGPFTFDLAGTSFDAMLDVFLVEGPIDPALDPPFGRMQTVAHNNDYGTRQASRVSFLADPAGTVASLTDFVVPPPRLVVQRGVGARIELSWPGAYAGWELQVSPSLSVGAVWPNVLPPGAVPDVSPTGDWQVTAPV
jgi:hypothetical protein